MFSTKAYPLRQAVLVTFHQTRAAASRASTAAAGGPYGKHGRLSLALACAALALMAAGDAPAHASRAQATFFEANTELLNAAQRPRTIATLKRLGVKALRVELYWRDVAPGASGSRRPSFDATSPASYHWGQYDALLAEATRLKWQVLLTVTSPVPRWATARHRDFLTSPNTRAFKEFMEAVGRHYGSEVSLYAIYNEPNHPAFLRPQFNSSGQPVSPRIYRGLFQEGYAGLRAAGISKPRVLMGETAPFGFDRVDARREGVLHDVAPLAFLRDALCLDSRYRRSSTCATLPVYGYAHHAYTTAAGPFYRPRGADDVTIGVLGRLSTALDRAARARALPAHIPIYLTEFGVQSYPNRLLGVPLPRQAEWDALCEKLAWQNGRVAAFSQYLLRDDPLGGRPGSSVHGGFIGFQTGLIEHDGRLKPLYHGFPVPLVVSRAGRGYSLWGLVRPTAGRTKLRVLVQTRGSRRYRTLKVVSTDSRGYWTLRSAVQAAHWRVSWRSPSGAVYDGPPIGVT